MKVVLHVDSPARGWFFGAAISNAVRFDVMGVYWYSYWSRNDTSNTRCRSKTCLSTGYPGQPVTNGNVGYAQTPEGQRDYLYDLINTLRNLNNGRCLGVVYWIP